MVPLEAVPLFVSLKPAELREASRHSRPQRAHVRGLSRRNNLRAGLTLGLDWGLIVAAAAVSIEFPQPWIYVLSVMVIARQMNALSELHHHAIHRNLFRGRELNDRLEFLYSLPLCNRVAADRASHMEHHRTYDVARGDHLTWGTGYGMDPQRIADRSYMLRFLLIRPFSGVLQYAALKDLILSPIWRDPPSRQVLLLFWCIVAAGFGLAGRLDILFWYWLVPYFSLFQVYFFWDDMLGHFNCPRTGTRDMRGFAFCLITAHSTTHHNIHHVFPGIPWFNMGRATREFLDEREMDVARGFRDGVMQMLEPERSRDPAFTS